MCIKMLIRAFLEFAKKLLQRAMQHAQCALQFPQVLRGILPPKAY